jgi:hypothetical protein
MAVAQGYGKTVTSGSVFAYDVADTRNSYKGEPTVNAISNADTMASWTNYYRTVASSTFTTEFGTTGYRFVNQPSWNGIYRNFNLSTAGYYTFSAWIRYNGGSAANNGATVYISNYGGGDTSSIIDKSLIGVWQKISITPYVTSPSNVYFYLISYGGTDNGTGTPDYSSWEVTMPQIELKTHATQFVNGTRSATQGLLPLAGNSTIDLTNMSFDSNAQMVFDGTNDYAVTSNIPAMSNWTAEVVMNLSNYTTAQKVILDLNLGIRLETSAGYFNSHFGNGTGWIYTNLPSTSTYTANKYYHIVIAVESGGQAKMYINGILDNSINIGSGTTPTLPLYIGRYSQSSGYEITGTMPVTRIYNRALTAQEVKQNFDFYDARIGIEVDTYYFAVSNRAAKVHRRHWDGSGFYYFKGKNMAATTPAYVLYQKPDASNGIVGSYTELASDSIGTPARLTVFGPQTSYNSGRYFTNVTVRKSKIGGKLSFEFPSGGTSQYGEAFYKTIITPYVP